MTSDKFGDHIVVDTINSNIDASGKDDTVLVYANGAVVNGGAGDDWLTTSFYVESEDSAEANEATTELHGDAGDDNIHASLRMDTLYSESSSIAAKLDGGDGSDRIWLDMSSIDASYGATVDGGLGADDIRVTAIGDGDTYNSGGEITVDAGGDDDVVRIHTNGRSMGDDITVHAGGGNDLVEASSSSVTVEGYLAGESYLYGGSGNDTLIGNAARLNEAEGGSGNDRIDLVVDGHNMASGGEGSDWIRAKALVGAGVFGYGFGDNSISGGNGDDTVKAVLDFSFSGAGTSEIQGDDGNDRLSATITFALDPDAEWEPSSAIGTSIVEGGNGDDRLSGVVKVSGELPDEFAFHSELYGGEGDDRLSVKGGDGNRLEGNQGDDVLLGGSGSDRLIGGQGDDYLRGRGGEDAFVFGSIRAGERDRIADFAIGEDRIDLSGIDANVFRSGDQAFRFGAREGTGRAWIEQSDGSSSILHADNGRQVLEVVLIDGRDVGPGDYSADDFLL